MAIFYVRTSGSDSNDGLTPATAWRTINKSLSSTGIDSGDTVYIGGGIYREIVSVGMTSATSETFVIGDVDGTKTGDAGKVILTAQVSGNRLLGPTANTTTLTINSKNYLTFNNLIILSSSGSIVGLCSTISGTSQNIKFYKCIFKVAGAGSSSSAMTITQSGMQLNHVFDSCIFYGQTGATMPINLATVSGPDYNVNILIINCIFYSTTAGSIQVSSSGSLIGEGGGITIINCTKHVGGGNFVGVGTSAANNRIGGANRIYPVIILNCIAYGGLSVSLRFGAILENYNFIISRTNIPIGLNSSYIIDALFDAGEENLLGFNKLSFGNFNKQNLLALQGNGAIDLEVDMLGYPAKAGATNVLFEGTINAITGRAITDETKVFGNTTLQGFNFKMLDGPAAGYTKTINGNTNTVFSGDGLWPIDPNVGNKYVIYPGPNSLISKVSSGSSMTLIDNNARWGNNFWQGYTLRCISGVSNGENFIVSGNSATTITGYFPLSTIPSSGDIYEIFWGSVFRGTVSTGSEYTITDNLADWPTTRATGTTGIGMGIWNAYTCMITSGAASGSYFYISGQGVNSLSGWSPFAIIPQSGDKYAIYQTTGYPTGNLPSGYVPGYDRNYINGPIGCYAVPNTAIKETGIVLSGANSIRLFGPACHDFQFPVSGATTLSVFGYYNDYYLGANPQLKILNGTGIGIADNTATMMGASGQWEQLRLSFTGSQNGYITARLQSNVTGIGGSAYFDCFNVS